MYYSCWLHWPRGNTLVSMCLLFCCLLLRNLMPLFGTLLFHSSFPWFGTLLFHSSPSAGFGGPALCTPRHHHHGCRHPLCWRLTHCHRVLPSQVSYGLIGWVGVGIEYSKSFLCICKHTATRIRI